MKKVLFLTNIPAPYTVDFFERLGQKYDLTVLFERKKAKNRKSEWIKYQYNFFKAVYLSGYPCGDELAFCPGVLKYLKKKSYDLIIVGDYSSPTGILAICYLKICGIPYFIHVDGGTVNKETYFKFAVKKLLLSRASGYMSSGRKTDEYLVYYGADINVCHHYPFTSISEKDIVKSIKSKGEKRLLRKKLYKENFTGSEFIIISVGNVIYRKGFDILIRAAKYIPQEAHIYIIGGGETEDLSQLMQDLCVINVHFIPFIPYKKVKEYLECADIFAFPTRLDIWGLVINEAMAAGLPIITTDHCVAGVELVTQNKNGYIIPIDSPEILAEHINELISRPDLLAQMSENSRKGIMDYTIENMVVEYSNHIENYITIK